MAPLFSPSLSLSLCLSLTLSRAYYQDKYVLRIDLWDWERGHAYAVYTPFHLEDEKNNYKIRVGQYSGTAGNAFDASKLHSHKGRREVNRQVVRRVDGQTCR